MVEWEVVPAEVLQLRWHILLNQLPIFPVDVTSLHTILQLYVGEALWCMWCKTERTSDLFLTSWQTVAQYLGLTENDMKILNKKEKWERKDARSPLKWKCKICFLRKHTGSWLKLCYHFLWQILLGKYVTSYSHAVVFKCSWGWNLKIHGSHYVASSPEHTMGMLCCITITNWSLI